MKNKVDVKITTGSEGLTISFEKGSPFSSRPSIVIVERKISKSEARWMGLALLNYGMERR